MATDVIITVVSCNTLEPANGYRGFVGAPTPAGRFAGPIADTTQYAGENIAFPVLDISVGKVTLGNLADVLRYVRMRRASPLAIHNLVEIIRVISIRGLHF